MGLWLRLVSPKEVIKRKAIKPMLIGLVVSIAVPYLQPKLTLTMSA